MKHSFLLRTVLLLSLLLLPLVSLTAQEANDPRLQTYLHTLQNGDIPRIIEDHLVLTYVSRIPVRYVAAAFAHESFGELHLYRKNQNGIFVLAYPLKGLPAGLRDELRYRIVVDGLWMQDPLNPDQQQDSRGIPLSRKVLPTRPQTLLDTPIANPDGTYSFIYTGDSGMDVRLAGDFNRWSPFSHPLREVSPGEYELKLRLYEGLHRYRFIVNGEERFDERNPRTGYDQYGRRISLITVPPANSEGALLAERR